MGCGQRECQILRPTIPVPVYPFRATFASVLRFNPSSKQMAAFYDRFKIRKSKTEKMKETKRGNLDKLKTPSKTSRFRNKYCPNGDHCGRESAIVPVTDVPLIPGSQDYLTIKQTYAFGWQHRPSLQQIFKEKTSSRKRVLAKRLARHFTFGRSRVLTPVPPDQIRRMLGQYQPLSTYHLPSAPILTIPIPNLPVSVAEKALESLLRSEKVVFRRSNGPPLNPFNVDRLDDCATAVVMFASAGLVELRSHLNVLKRSDDAAAAAAVFTVSAAKRTF
ncbi:hypothetical protein GEV33_013051 [Tenebrio molitor]|uniref:Uncharacterized protein n=1 Tax=Tenebrio molitor TaxID=7067 RepID=A0A8J6L2Z3_TENMO|nr:hypothetical protein GEV33_013051 [Tenebrio molitor]